MGLSHIEIFSSCREALKEHSKRTKDILLENVGEKKMDKNFDRVFLTQLQARERIEKVVG